MANGTFDITQTDAQLQAILDRIQPLATTGDMATLGYGYGVCDTAGATAAKTVSMTNTVLTPGGIIAVLFENAFTASSSTLSVNGSAAKPIKLFGNAMPMGKVKNNTILVMNYDGTNFNVIAIESQVAAAPDGFVDLALPSGVLWADKNVGAATPYEDGLYFSWGNIVGHTGDDGYDFGMSNDGPYASTPGAALTGNIPTNNTYDAARHNMGAPCRMPTVGEFQELNAQCDSEWTDEDGVAGRRFTSEEAKAFGLVNVVVDETEMIDTERKYIEHFMQASPDAIAECKHLLRLVNGTADRYNPIFMDTSVLIANQRISKAGQEGMKAFFEKRKPNWK